MSLEAILAAIEAAGEAELAQVQANLEAQLAQIEREAEAAAEAQHAAAAQAARAPAGRECARIEHNARLEGLRVLGQTRQMLIDTALGETAQQLAAVRQRPDYPGLLRRLIAEALDTLGPQEIAAAPPHVCVDGRDEAAARACLNANGLAPRATLEATLAGWGGAIVRSGDGQIVIDNRLEARLERALPVLRRTLAEAFERAARDEPPAADNTRRLAAAAG